MSKEDILYFLRTNKEYLHEQFGVTRIALFGSYATNTAQEQSDIDIAVEMENKNKFRNYFALRRYLEESLHKSVDLAIENSLKPVVKENIQKELIRV